MGSIAGSGHGDRDTGRGAEQVVMEGRGHQGRVTEQRRTGENEGSEGNEDQGGAV